MDRQRELRVRDIFLAALDISPERRREFIVERCGGDAELLAAVIKLSDADGNAPSKFLAQPLITASGSSDDASTIPASGFVIADRIGPHRLLELIGRGGMGEVWKAEQTEPMRRFVALKIIKAGMDSAEVIARFEAERQALALMDHPCIAKVYHAGTTEQGRPYFAMEYVPGTPITEYCDRRRLSTEERLKLFQKVCDGVQHAHFKSVIHRDLKPSNVLVMDVDGVPQPKIIDFGVAKATAQRLTEKTMFTAMGQLIGTPEYMSPEQADLTGEDIDARTDVYSLGIILYELLVGSLPLDAKALRQAGFDGMRRMIRELEPPRPSTRLSSLGVSAGDVASNRSTRRQTLHGQLRGDLDWITMMALEKNRNRRFATPHDLAEDLGRYLRHEVVRARPPSVPYRTRKYVRRHRVAVAFIGTVFSLLVAALIITGNLWRQSVHSRDLAQAEARRAKASTLLALSHNAEHPSEALAFATASLQQSDQTEARRQAVRLLQRGAAAFQFSHLPDAWNPWTVEFSPDERWLAVGWSRGGHVQLHALSGSGAPIQMQADYTWIKSSAFSSDSRLLAMGVDGALLIFSTSDGKLLHRLPFHGVPWPRFSPTLGGFLVGDAVSGSVPQWQVVSPEGEVKQQLGQAGPTVRGSYFPLCIDHSGSRIVSWSDTEVFVHDIEGGRIGPATHVGSHRFPVLLAEFDQQGLRLATADSAEIRVWSLARPEQPDFVFRGDSNPTGACFDDSGSRLALASVSGLRIWDLTAPAWMGPTLLAHGNWVFLPAFHPSGQWIAASAHGQKVWAWPLSHPLPITIDGIEGTFSPDGQSLATTHLDGSIRLRSMDAGAAAKPRVLVSMPGVTFTGLTFDASGDNLYAGGQSMVGDSRKENFESGIVIGVSILSGEVKLWRDPPAGLIQFCDATGQWLASAGGSLTGEYTVLFDTTSGHGQTIRVDGVLSTLPLGFTGDGRLALKAATRFHLWDPVTSKCESLALDAEEVQYQMRPGQFIWLDKSGHYWFGDLIGGNARTLPIGTDDRHDLIADAFGDWVVAGYPDGSVELSHLDGGPPQLLLGTATTVQSVSLDPLGRWIATSTYDLNEETTLWPFPTGVPLQSLPRDELIAKLESLTNLRAVADSTGSGGYVLQYDPFPGWDPVPTW